MSDVACICSAPIIAETRRRGLDVNRLVAGLGVPIDVIEDPRRRMPWHSFTEFAGRASDLLGTAAIQDLAAGATVEFAPRPLRRVLPHLRDSRPLFAWAPRWWGPWVFRGSRGSCETLSDGRLREVVKILPEFAACPEFLEGLQGTLRGMPRLLNQPDALVTVDHDGREAEFLITPPPRRASRFWGRQEEVEIRELRESTNSGSWFSRLGLRREKAEAHQALEAFGFAREQILQDARTISRLTREVDEQSRSLRSLERLSQTLVDADTTDPQSFRQELVDFLAAECDFEGVLMKPRGQRGTDAVAAGHRVGASSREVMLSVGLREVGVLELWGTVAGHKQTRLDFISPWIAFALECVGSKSLTKHLIELLSQDMHDWDEMTRRLSDLQIEHVEDDIVH